MVSPWRPGVRRGCPRVCPCVLVGVMWAECEALESDQMIHKSWRRAEDKEACLCFIHSAYYTGGAFPSILPKCVMLRVLIPTRDSSASDLVFSAVLD